MAYGSAKGRIFRGDIYAEDDPNQDTYIDWGNDFISFGVGGIKVLNVSASNTLVQVLGNVSASLNMTASGHVSASAYYGDGQYLKNVGGGGSLSTTTGGGNNTLFLPFVSSSTGVGSATLFTAGALSLKPQSGSLTLAGDGQSGVSGSFLGEFTTTSSYGSRVALKGANVGTAAGTEPYIHPVSSSYTVPAGFFGGGQPPSDVRINYETLEIVAPSGLSRGGDVSISGSGNLHISFTNPTGSGGWPFTPTWQSTMEFGSLETAVYLTSSIAGNMISSPWSIINGASADGAMYGGIDYDSEGWYFDSGSNSNVTKFSSPLQGEWTGDFNFRSPGSASFFNGLIVHNVPLTSNVGAQIGGTSTNSFVVQVTSSFNNNAMFAGPQVSISNALTSNSNQLFISGAVGGGMSVNITSSDSNNNSLYTGGGALLGHRGSGQADIRLFAGGSGQAGTISGSNTLQMGGSAQIKGNIIAEGNLNTTGGNISGSGALMIGGNATIAGNTILGDGSDSITFKVNSMQSTGEGIAWKLMSGSVGTGSGPGKNGPLMFYISASSGTTDLLKFNTSGSNVGTVFPRTFYPSNASSVDMGNSALAFRTVFATKIGSAGNFTIDGVNATNSNFVMEMPNNASEAFMVRDQTAGSNWMTMGTNAGSGYRVNISKPTYIGSDESAAPKITLDVHYSGSKSPVNLDPNTGGGEVVYFGTGSLTDVGALHYLNSKGGWVPTNADATGNGLTGDGGHKQLLGISLGTNPQASGMLIRGFFNVSGAVEYYRGDFMTGSAVYVQAQSAPGQGRMSGSAPTGSGQFVRIVGYATDTPKVVYFNPDSTYVEIS